MKTELMTITPEMARKCLERNKISNRSLSQSRVKAIADDIRNGRWRITHQGIAFDDDGNLLDGQHRLAGCSEANMPITTLVTKGLKIDDCIAIDNTRPRTITDHARQVGLDISTSHSSIATCLEFGASFHDHTSADTRLELIEKYIDGIGFAVKICRSAIGFQAPCKAVMARAYYTQDHEKLKRFMDVYISMIPEGRTESAATTLRKFLTTGNHYGWAAREEMYRKTESALFAFINGTPMSKIYGTDKELFPIPPKVLARKVIDFCR